MKGFFITVFLSLTPLTLSAQALETDSAEMRQKYLDAATELQQKMAAYDGPGGGEQFKNEQLHNIKKSRQLLEQYRSSEMISDEDYRGAKNSMSQAESFIKSGYASESWAALQAMGESYKTKISACDPLKEDEEAYGECVQAVMGQ